MRSSASSPSRDEFDELLRLDRGTLRCRRRARWRRRSAILLALVGLACDDEPTEPEAPEGSSPRPEVTEAALQFEWRGAAGLGTMGLAASLLEPGKRLWLQPGDTLCELAREAKGFDDPRCRRMHESAKGGVLVAGGERPVVAVGSPEDAEATKAAARPRPSEVDIVLVDAFSGKSLGPWPPRRDGGAVRSSDVALVPGVNKGGSVVSSPVATAGDSRIVFEQGKIHVEDRNGTRTKTIAGRWAADEYAVGEHETCDTSSTGVAASWMHRPSERGPGAPIAAWGKTPFDPTLTMAFVTKGQWSKAVEVTLPEDRDRDSPLTCMADEGSLVWGRKAGDGGQRVGRVICRATGCDVKEVDLELEGFERWLLVARVGRATVALWARADGSIAYRAGELHQLPTIPTTELKHVGTGDEASYRPWPKGVAEVTSLPAWVDGNAMALLVWGRQIRVLQIVT